MELSLVPVVILLGLIFFAGPSNPGVVVEDPSGSELQITSGPVDVTVDEKVFNDALEYETIYAYITTIYKYIPKEDAQLIAKYLVDYGKEHDVDPKFAAALMAKESSFNKKAVSETGAKGLGQIKSFNFKPLKIKNPFDIQQNVSGTVSYLKEKLGNWNSKSNQVSLALASYYKGYSAVKKQQEKLDLPTKRYVNDIMENYEALKKMKDKVSEGRI